MCARAHVCVGEQVVKAPDFEALSAIYTHAELKF